MIHVLWCLRHRMQQSWRLRDQRGNQQSSRGLRLRQSPEDSQWHCSLILLAMHQVKSADADQSNGDHFQNKQNSLEPA
jgi:hypothetical protein